MQQHSEQSRGPYTGILVSAGPSDFVEPDSIELERAEVLRKMVGERPAVVPTGPYDYKWHRVASGRDY